MSATKVTSTWGSGNLIFKEKVAANSGQVIFGHTNGGVDVKFYGTTSSKYVLFDESADTVIAEGVDVRLNDADYLKFGDSTDMSLAWDGSKLALTGATTSTFQMGTSDANIDLVVVGSITYGTTGAGGGEDNTWYGTTAANYMKWGSTANTLIFEGADVRLNDTDYLKLGDSTDISLAWDSAKLALTGAAASTFQLGSSGTNINTRFVGTVIVGSTGKSAGRDVTLYGTTAVNYAKWNATANNLTLDGSDIKLLDSDYLKLGDSTDASLCWDTAKVALTGAAAASTFQLGSSGNDINTRFVGTIIVGSTGKSLGKDVTLYGTTAVNYMKWTAASNLLEFDGADIHLDDSDYLKLGDSTDISLAWDSAKLALTGNAASSTFQLGSSGNDINTRFVGTVIVGSTGNSAGKNVTLYGTTAVNYMQWDSTSNTLVLDGADIRLNDTDYLKLGDSTDISLAWDTAKLALTGAAASTFQLGTSGTNINTRFVGTVIVGSTGGSAGADVTLYGTTAANFVRMDASENELLLTNCDILMGNTAAIKGTSTANQGFEIKAYGTDYTEVISVQNSTGDAKVKLGFFGVTPTSKATNAVQLAPTTSFTTTVQTRVNTILALLKTYGLMATS